MTEEEKILRVQTVLDDPDATDELIAIYLDYARDAILTRIYPFGRPNDYEVEMPERYEQIQCQLAERYFLRRGGQGEIVHNENGVNRTYDSVDDKDLLNKIVPLAKVIKNQYATT